MSRWICACAAHALTGFNRVDCDHVFCRACLVEFIEVEEKEYGIVGLYQCPVRLCSGIIDSSPVRDLTTEGLVSQLHLAEGKEVIDTPTAATFFDKYFFLDAYLESCVKPPTASQ